MSRKKTYRYLCEGADLELADGEKNGVRYIKKKTFQNAADDGLEYRIVGRTALKAAQADEDEKDLLQADGAGFIVDAYRQRAVKGYIPVGEGRYAEYVGVWLPAILLPILLVLAAGIVLGVCLLRGEKSEAEAAAFVPKDTIEQPAEENTADEPDLTLSVELPNGECSVEGTVNEPESAEKILAAADPETKQAERESAVPYTGTVHMKAELQLDGGLHTLIDIDAQATDGILPDFTLDFTILDFELQPGVYYGTIVITYPDGSEIEMPLKIVIRQDNTGSMSIDYAPGVTVDLASDTITCSYAPDRNDTHDTVVEVVLINDGEEYVISRSDAVQPGQTLTGMALDTSMKSRLTPGVYDGYLRLYFSADTDKSNITDITTDLEIDITVQ